MHTQWTHDLLGEKCPKVTFRLGNREKAPKRPRDFSKDSGFEDEDYFYLDDDYLLFEKMSERTRPARKNCFGYSVGHQWSKKDC